MIIIKIKHSSPVEYTRGGEAEMRGGDGDINAGEDISSRYIWFGMKPLLNLITKRNII